MGYVIDLPFPSQADFDALKARVEQLEIQVAKLLEQRDERQRESGTSGKP